MKKTYQIFGLNILSEIELPSPNIKASNFDAEIVFGKVDYPPPSFAAKGVCFYAKKNEVSYEIKDIARYKVSDGKQIIIEPLADADVESIKLFLNGPVFGALLLQKGLLPLHAAAFEYNGKAILISGNSGIGKSSTVAHIAKQGYKLIADDISCVRIVNNQVKVFSSGNYIKLWKDSLQKLELEHKDLKKVRNKLEKFLYPVQTSSDSWIVNKIYFLKSHNLNHVTIAAIKGAERFASIKDNTYRKVLIKGLEIEKEFFSLAMKIAMNVSVSTITRPNFGFHVEAIANAIMDDVNEADEQGR